MPNEHKHSQAVLWPSEIVTLGLLHALKGISNRAFYGGLTRDLRALFPHLPERTRWFRLLKTHQAWTFQFLAKPTLLGIVDRFGIELIHPIREGRSPQQLGRKGVSNHRWIVGGKRCLVVNHLGAIGGWVWAPANAQDRWFHLIIELFQDHIVVLDDTGFHAQTGDPANLKLCRRGEWNDRMLTETVLSMRTQVCHFKQRKHRVAEYFQARLAISMALFSVLIQWHGLTANKDGFVALPIE